MESIGKCLGREEEPELKSWPSLSLSSSTNSLLVASSSTEEAHERREEMR
jgi:hypothetical protein